MITETYRLSTAGLERSAELKRSGLTWPEVAETLRLEGFGNLHNASVASQTIAVFPELRQREYKKKRKYTKRKVVRQASVKTDVNAFINAMKRANISSDEIVRVLKNLL